MGYEDIWPRMESMKSKSRSGHREETNIPPNWGQRTSSLGGTIIMVLSYIETHVRAIQGAIREIWKKLYGVSCANDFMTYQAADPYEVSDYEEGVGRGPDDELQLALHAGTRNMHWNRVIMSKLVQSIQDTRNADSQKWSLPDVTEKYILALITNQFTEAQRAYSLATPRIIRREDGEVRRETDEEVEARIHSYYHGSDNNLARWKSVEGRTLRRQVRARCNIRFPEIQNFVRNTNDA
ncbi:hypothetical protein GYMLUDRAFT_61826 [Collybiopsis luxurians FD-317 M1]|uniref:Unplaced genomic scaffold GYMLUscaffold_47, whole genome shotgun sequence n=1 Tax=Collybiopsis luxurians FD-317 M1 TaxID=944289 RepID=A0A0D0CNE8_9AGAR|nr:hypothetical protein GYMLUDRAFT_61826 [Collybiopsis luxurians FD-317 M1]